ncbi:MAG: GNAT family N-acetyltransferase [Desemzia incerta]
MIWGKESITTFLAIENDKLIGLGSLWQNSIRPYREYIGIYIDPEYRKKGIGKELFDQLYLNSDTKKLQVSVKSTDQAATNFLIKCGFELARKCYTPNLTEAKISNLETSQVNGEIYSLGMVTDKIQDQAFKLQLKNYINFHKRINPLREDITTAQWKEIIIDDLNFQESKLLIKNEEIKAYVFCYSTDNSREIEIGYIDGIDIDDIKSYMPFYKKVMDDLIAQFEIVNIEADDVDPYAFAALKCYRYDASLSLDVYIL